MAAARGAAKRRAPRRAGRIRGAYGVSADGTRYALDFDRIVFDVGGHQLEVEFRDRVGKPPEALACSAETARIVVAPGAANLMYVSLEPFQALRRRSGR